MVFADASRYFYRLGVRLSDAFTFKYRGDECGGEGIPGADGVRHLNLGRLHMRKQAVRAVDLTESRSAGIDKVVQGEFVDDGRDPVQPGQLLNLRELVFVQFEDRSPFKRSSDNLLAVIMLTQIDVEHLHRTSRDGIKNPEDCLAGCL